MKKNSEIDIRDTYILTYNGKYYMYGTTGRDAFTGSKSGFRCYVGKDLENWEGPYTVFANDGSVWADQNYWAPEVYEVNGTFYMFTAWSKKGSHFSDQTLAVLKADNPLGPFTVVNDRLGKGNDPTLYEDNNKYYLIHNDGFLKMYVTPISEDFTHFIGESVCIFAREDKDVTWSVGGPTEGAETFVTPSGRLLVLWSSFCKGSSKKFEKMGFHNMDYGTAIAYSANGDVYGPYVQENEMITPPNMGHCNLFYDLSGKLKLSTHWPDDDNNDFGCSNPLFFDVEYDEKIDSVRINKKQFEMYDIATCG